MSRNRALLLGAACMLLGVAVAVPAAVWQRGHARHLARAGAAAPGSPGSLSPEGSAPPASGTPGVTPRASATGAAPALGRSGTLHYIVNVGAQRDAVAALGYNLHDMGPERGPIDALPAGQRALVWLGSLGGDTCATPSYTFAQFTVAVDRLVGDPKVYGYFLADEPHPRTCPAAVAEIRQRADYIHSHDPSHKSFIVVLDGTNHCGGTYGCEYDALRPANTHVDLVGLDPYPCNVDNAAAGCSYRKIDDTVQRAVAHGIPAAAVVPVFEAFGQSCASGGGSTYYRLPTAAEMRTMLARWAALVPHPAFDYTYTWGHQGSACPTLVDAPDLQSVLRAHNQS